MSANKMQSLFSRLMSMDDETWERHASPYSVWTRLVTGLPLILLAIWSIKPLGYHSILVVLAVAAWIWLNPRLFAKPEDTDNWASMVTLGERIWLNRAQKVIPTHHAQWAIFLSALTGLGFLIAALSAYLNLFWPTLAGGLVSWIGKMWFCDRMVWLYRDMHKLPPHFH